MTGSADAARRFEIGRVIRTTFSGVRAVGPAVLPLLVLFVVAPDVLVAVAESYFHVESSELLLFTSIVGLMGLVVAAAAIRGALDHFAGHKPRFAPALRAGVRYFLPLLAIQFLTSLGIIFGLLLLIVPGLYWAASWSVASAVRVAEFSSSQSAIGRSAELTKGYRWPIFGLLLMFLVGYAALIWLSGAGFGPPVAQLVWSVATNLIADSAYEVFMGVGCAAIYWELVRIRGAGVPGDITEIFA